MADDPVADDPPADAGHDPPPVSAGERRLISFQHWALAHWPRNRRRQAAIVLALMAAVLGTAIASAHLLRWIHEWLDLLAYAGLFVTCWIGAGGLLVPIPGVRWVGLLMIVQQGATLQPGVTALVAASAMLLGQTSWFLAARATAQARRKGAATAPADAAVTGVAPDPAMPPAGVVVADPAADPGAAASTSAASTSAVATAPDAATPDAIPVASSAPAAGRRARLAARSARARATTERRLREHAVATLYMAGLIPSPLTSIASSTSGAIGIPMARFVVAIFAGFLTLAGVLAFFGDTLADAIQRFHPFG